MAACNLWASSFKITSLNLGSTTPKLTRFHDVKIQSLIQYNGPVISLKAKKPLIGCRCSTSEAQSKTSSVGNQKKIVPSAKVSQLIAYQSEIEYLLTAFSDTASIVEFEIKLGGFQLRVMRNLNVQSQSPPPITASLAVSKDVEATNSNGSISMLSLALSKPLASPGGSDTLLARAADEGLVVIQSPRVGFFRRSHTIKGKRAPPSCKEKQVVKEGQVICYIEQLGGEVPIESDVSGEVVNILLEDGAPVGYGDPIISILPSLLGIKELQ